MIKYKYDEKGNIVRKPQILDWVFYWLFFVAGASLIALMISWVM